MTAHQHVFLGESTCEGCGMSEGQYLRNRFADVAIHRDRLRAMVAQITTILTDAGIPTPDPVEGVRALVADRDRERDAADVAEMERDRARDAAEGALAEIDRLRSELKMAETERDRSYKALELTESFRIPKLRERVKAIESALALVEGVLVELICDASGYFTRGPRTRRLDEALAAVRAARKGTQ